MKTGDAAKQFNVSPQTVRNWLTEFSQYFDEKDTRQSTIGQDGFIILATIAELSTDGLNYSQIHDKLKSGYRADELSAYTMPVDLIPLKAAVDSSKIAAELEIIKQDRDRLADLLEQERDAHNQTRRDMEGKVESLHEQLRQAERAIGRLEGRLEEIDKRNNRT